MYFPEANLSAPEAPNSTNQFAQRPPSPATIRKSCVYDLKLVSAVDRSFRVEQATLRRVIRAAGAKLFFLPPQPDLNPIEQVFAKLNTLLRKAAERTVDATWKRIGTLLTCYAPKECANYFANAGYAST